MESAIEDAAFVALAFRQLRHRLTTEARLTPSGEAVVDAILALQRNGGRIEPASDQDAVLDSEYDAGVRAAARIARAALSATPSTTGAGTMREAAALELEARAERARTAAIGGGMDPTDATLLDYEYSNAAAAIRNLPIQGADNVG
jgi:hypothetical protein